MSKQEDAHSYSFQVRIRISLFRLHLLILLQLATQPGGACIVPHQVHAPKFEVDMLLHVSDPFTNQPQQRSAVQFIVELLCQADKLESDFLFVNYHQDLIVGLFESLFKAAMTPEFFHDIVKSNSVHTVLTLLRRRVRLSLHFSRLCPCLQCVTRYRSFVATYRLERPQL